MVYNIEHPLIGDWKNYTFSNNDGELIPLNNIGDIVQFRNRNNELSLSTSKYVRFEMSGLIESSGNIQSLLKYSDNVPAYSYCYLLSGCTSLKSVPELPATSIGNYGYYYMFTNCKSITKTPELPATSIGSNGYSRMFKGCVQLSSTIKKLPATVISNNSYSYMFQNCSSLIIAPELDVEKFNGSNACEAMFYGCTSLTKAPSLLKPMKLTISCYNSMFYKCTSLSASPILPASGLAKTCYQSMFNGCSLLSEISELSSTTLVSGCYYNMFNNCTSLTKVPELPATELAPSCYLAMFKGCTLIKNAPELPAAILDIECYKNMFMGCSSLSSIEVGFTDWSPSNATTNWLGSVASRGEFNCPVGLDTSQTGSSKVPINWKITHPLTITAAEDNVNIKLTAKGSPTVNGLQYRTNDSSWKSYDIDTDISLNQNEYVEFRNMKNELSIGYPDFDIQDEDIDIDVYFDNYVQFAITGQVNSTGNIQSMLNYSDSCTNYCYFNMFNGCSGLLTAPELPASGLAKYCYSNMFKDCTSLTQAPELPASTLANYCYMNMFYNCINLLTTPELPATTIRGGAYYSMFNGCSKLETIKIENMDIIGGESCVGMFSGCTSLTGVTNFNVSKIGSTGCINMFRNCTSLSSVNNFKEITFTGVKNCLNMFNGCSSLIYAPELDIDELTPSCYYGMFEGCTNLLNLPELSATTLVDGCYQRMFYNCSSLSSISVRFTDWNSSQNSTTDWVTNVASDGEFNCPGSLSIEFGDSKIPNSNWVIYNPLTITAVEDNVNVKLIKGEGSPTVNGLQYRTSDSNWQTYSVNTTNIPLSSNEYVEFRNTETELSKGLHDYVKFAITGQVNADGNVQSMLNYSDSVPSYGYYNLFNSCSGLLTAPELPATILTSGCYQQMFIGCSGLLVAPELPATELAEHCYISMFRRCVSLTEAPYLPASALVTYCYNNMFYDCISLSSVTVDFTSWGADGEHCTSDWLKNTALSGVFEGPANLLPTSNTSSRIPEHWYVKIPLTFKTTSTTSSSIKLMKTDGSPVIGGLQYRKNKTNINDEWTNYTIGTEISLNSGDMVQFKNTLNDLSSNGNYVKFVVPNDGGDVSALGNIQSLLDYSNSVPNYGFYGLFRGCSKLKTAPLMLANKVGHESYGHMFENCTGLTQAPKLPAEKLDTWCYANMFEGCSNIVGGIDILPATTLKGQCYHSMFKGCSSLIQAPELPATTILSQCYVMMFNMCQALSSITVGFTDWDLGATDGWLIGVSSNGKFNCPDILPMETGNDRIPGTWNIINNPLRIIAAEDNVNVQLSAIGSPTINGLQYRQDDLDDWQIYNIGTNISLNQDEYIEFKNTQTSLSLSSNTNFVRFVITGQVNTTGNIQSMLNYSRSVPNYGFYSLFRGCSGLLSTPDLPAATVNKYGYQAMFYSCSSLSSVTKMLPASSVTTNSYGYMFRGCSSLINPPELRMNTINGGSACEAMFYDCSLLSAGPELKPLTLNQSCYNSMFWGCTSLSLPPELPASGLAKSCYQSMFRGCSSLETAPVLSATTLYQQCYLGMFRGCTNLIDAPTLPATELVNSCYKEMFYGCSSLSSISVRFIDWNSSQNSTTSWVNNVALYGEFKCPGALDTSTYNSSYVPCDESNKWTVINI